MVAGYKKEYFFYLEEKHGVSIVVNEEYATRNNHSSLMAVRERLGNTFICSSDNYFVENPFEPYVWKAYYAAQYQEGPTNEWCMRLGSGNRIVSVDIGGSDSLIMLGHVYFDKNFSRAFSRILEEEYDLPTTADKLWEELYVDHIAELDMVAREYPVGTYSSSTHSTSCANSIRVSWKTSIPRRSTISLQRSGATKTIFATCIR